MWQRRPSRSLMWGLSWTLEESKKKVRSPAAHGFARWTCMFLVLQRNSGEAARDVSEMVFVFI